LTDQDRLGWASPHNHSAERIRVKSLGRDDSRKSGSIPRKRSCSLDTGPPSEGLWVFRLRFKVIFGCAICKSGLISHVDGDEGPGSALSI